MNIPLNVLINAVQAMHDVHEADIEGKRMSGEKLINFLKSYGILAGYVEMISKNQNIEVTT